MSGVSHRHSHDAADGARYRTGTTASGRLRVQPIEQEREALASRHALDPEKALPVSGHGVLRQCRGPSRASSGTNATAG